MTRTLLVASLSFATFIITSPGIFRLKAEATQQKALTGADAPANAIWLDSLDLTKMVQRRGTPRAGKSGSGRGNNPPPLMLGGVQYAHGIGTLSINELIVDLKQQATKFESMIGIDDAARTGQGSVTYEIWVDNKRAFISPLMKAGDPPQFVSVN